MAKLKINGALDRAWFSVDPSCTDCRHDSDSARVDLNRSPQTETKVYVKPSNSPMATLLRMAELALTLNTSEFNGKIYKQTGGVAMGSRLRPNYDGLLLTTLKNVCFPVRAVFI